ncbi:plasma-membrane calcium-translocating P-type ATPase [Formivibrio citricus]|uniref:Plasma-membrane calcium-translocating P-type ATPase n=1 Tax=Formivibrio citricus TaxID=83765 RepID=A0A1I5A151_9NEIS|nr:cation-transporting P-type ATPase [Formivibrio citricus]SFN56156.1 plasma-membrane calcium-translocating P-type ATPase [Formivibrio citricus]
MTDARWHSQSPEDALEKHATTEGGLSAGEAAKRLASHGPNRLTPPKKRSAWLRFLLQFHNVLIYVLLGAASVTAMLGRPVDTLIIFGVVFINAVIGFIQEGKAEKSLDAIRNMLSQRATVMRDGRRQEIDAAEVVPGDIVLLASGDKVPADLRLVETRSLRIEEAALTGESEPVEKSPEAVPDKAPIGDRTCMAYSGTLVVFGQGRGVVTATGDATEIGRIGRLLAEVDTVETPLLKQMSVFGHWLTGGIVVLAGFTLLFGMLVHGQPAGEMFLAAVGLAVAAIPEGLPAIMTITLAIGVQRMAGRNAIIRRMPAVETLGAVTTICSDKTGTLTKNEMTVQRLVTAEQAIEVTGVGYAPHGGFVSDGKDVDPAELTDLARIALLCNDATLREHEGEWKLEGDPTEGALLTLAFKAGLNPHLEAERLPRVDVIPFESDHRFMATLHHDHAGHAMVFVKGAPERVIGMCNRLRSGGEDKPLETQAWQAQVETLAASGFRVLALACMPVEKGKRELTFGDVETGLTLLGLAGIMDPPRDEAKRAVAACHSAGIRVKMITGDHAVTAAAIARAMGLATGEGRALTGAEIESMSDEQLRQIVQEVDVYARASPEHKLRLVEAMQANGEVVAMTGDGVNDAPALKRADVGVAMGNKGTEAAKEAAEMVLADDNFASIAAAVEEGRTVYDNLRKAVVYVLPTSIGQATMVLIAVLSGMTLPITPVQILWVNMVTAVTLSLAIAFERPEPGLMARPPRDPKEPLLNGFMLWRIVFVTTLLVATSFGMFLWELDRGMELEFARTAAVNTLVMGQIFYLFNCRRLTAPVLSREGFLGNRYALQAIAVLMVLQFSITHLPFKQDLFGTDDLDGASWIRVVIAGVLILLAVEAEKRFWHNRHR